MTEKSTNKRKKSTIWLSLSGVFLLLLSGLLLLPSLLSTGWAENKIKQAVNSRIPGTINFDSLSLGWFDGIRSRNLTYDNRADGIMVKVEEIATAKGLLAIAANYKEIGEITVKTPTVNLYLNENAVPAGSALETSPDTPLKVPEKTSLDSKISRPDTPAKKERTITVPPIDGDLIVTGGAVNGILPGNKKIKLLKDLELKVRLAGHENLLDYQISFQSEDNLGRVKGTGAFTLPSANSTQPDEIKSEGQLDIEKWELTDLLSILAYGADIPSGSGQLDGRVDISGSTSTALQLKGNLIIQNIKLQGGPLKTDTPSLDKVAVTVDAKQTAGILTLNHLTLTSSLATVTASGRFESPDKNEISGHVEIDLENLFAQFPGSLNLKEGTMVSSGKVSVKARVGTSDGNTDFDGSARLDSLQGTAGDKKLIWDKPFIFKAKGEKNAEGLRLDNFAIKSAFINGSGQGDFNHMKIQLAADIGSALKEVEKFIQLEGWKSSGKMDMNVQLEKKSETLISTTTDVNITNFVLQKDKQKFHEKKISLQTSGIVDIEKRSISLKPFELRTDGGHIALPELLLSDWRNLPDGIKGKGRVDLDLGMLKPLLADMLKLHPETTVAGLTAFDIDTDMVADTKDKFIRLAADIGPLEIAVKGKRPVSEDSIRLVMDLKGDILKQNFTLNKLIFSSGPASFSATGTVTPEKLERVLSAEGSVELDLKAVSSHLKTLSDLDLQMTGSTQRPFTIKAKSINGRWAELQKQSEITASFHADTIRGYGLFIESLEVPVRLAGALAELDIQGTVNRGRMALNPAIDFTADIPVVAISENNNVLTGVGFSENMSNDLLAKIHPLFKGAAVSEGGTMDLALKHLKWPLDKAGSHAAAFAGIITFNEVKLRAGGFLTPLLNAMKANEREVTLGDQPMEFVGENGRITCSPLEIKTKEHILLLSGSIGFDQSLDYKAQIPVTRDMVGSSMYKYLEGTFITVPIGGTVSKPSLKKDILQAALKDLIKQAGKKQINDQAGKLLQNLFK